MISTVYKKRPGIRISGYDPPHISFFIYFLDISRVPCSFICSYKEFNVIQDKDPMSVTCENYETQHFR